MLRMMLTAEYDVIVTDRMLPQRDGLSIIRLLHVDQNLTPVLELSALGEVDDRVDGLRAVKPIRLQPREFRLLEYLMRHAGQVVTRTMLGTGMGFPLRSIR